VADFVWWVLVCVDFMRMTAGPFTKKKKKNGWVLLIRRRGFSVSVVCQRSLCSVRILVINQVVIQAPHISCSRDIFNCRVEHKLQSNCGSVSVCYTAVEWESRQHVFSSLWMVTPAAVTTTVQPCMPTRNSVLQGRGFVRE
jgi:hypothetical protein